MEQIIIVYQEDNETKIMYLHPDEDYMTMVEVLKLRGCTKVEVLEIVVTNVLYSECE